MTYIAIKSKDNCSEALEAARRYSPNIEIVDERTLVFDLTGSKAKEAPEIAAKLREKFVSVAVSENLSAGLLLATWSQAREFQVKKSGVRSQESDSSKQTLNSEPETLNSRPAEPLARLPIDAISRKAEFLELMDSWAVHDLGSFARLPEDEMVARFGLEIVELLKQARGESFRAVSWNVKEDKFFWAKDLEGAIETIEPLNFVLSKGVEQIFQNLDYAGLSTQSAKIILGGRGKEKVYRIRIVFPTKNQKLWIRQIVTKIELDTPGFNIERVEIEFRSTKPRTVQNNLYSGTVMEPENLNLIVTKLKKVVGLEKIGVPKLRDSWSERFYMTENLSPLIREEEFRVEESGVKIQESGKQFRVRKEKFKVQGSKFKVCETDDDKNKTNSNEQTLNSEPGTLNSPKEPLNSPKEPLNSPKEPEPGTLNSCFYYLPQPVKARVFFESGEPKALIIKGKREMVRTAGGPWRMDAEWYRAKEWRRDEWDIETETGAVYRVFTDKNGEAFIDGGYD